MGGRRPGGCAFGRVALYFRDDAPLLGRRRRGAPSSRRRPRTSSCAAPGRGACFFADLLVEIADVAAEELREALWDLVWAGEATNDAFAPLRGRAGVARGAGAAGAPLPGGAPALVGPRFAGAGAARRRCRAAGR